MVLDFLYRKQSVYTLASQGHVLSAGFGVVLIGFAGFNVLLSANGTLPALWLPFVGRSIAGLMGWHESFVGTLFVAFATSVPEIAVTIGALRIGAIDMAIANVLGSNLFDILILAIDGILYTPGPILSFVSPSHAVTAFSAIMMTGVAIVGLLYRPKTRVFKTVGWASLFLFSLYLLNTYVIYLYAE